MKKVFLFAVIFFIFLPPHAHAATMNTQTLTTISALPQKDAGASASITPNILHASLSSYIVLISSVIILGGIGYLLSFPSQHNKKQRKTNKKQ